MELPLQVLRGGRVQLPGDFQLLAQLLGGRPLGLARQHAQFAPQGGDVARGARQDRVGEGQGVFLVAGLLEVEVHKRVLGLEVVGLELQDGLEEVHRLLDVLPLFRRHVKAARPVGVEGVGVGRAGALLDGLGLVDVVGEAGEGGGVIAGVVEGHRLGPLRADLAVVVAGGDEPGRPDPEHQGQERPQHDQPPLRLRSHAHDRPDCVGNVGNPGRAEPRAAGTPGVRRVRRLRNRRSSRGASAARAGPEKPGSAVTGYRTKGRRGTSPRPARGGSAATPPSLSFGSVYRRRWRRSSR